MHLTETLQATLFIQIAYFHIFHRGGCDIQASLRLLAYFQLSPQTPKWGILIVQKTNDLAPLKVDTRTRIMCSVDGYCWEEDLLSWCLSPIKLLTLRRSPGSIATSL